MNRFVFSKNALCGAQLAIGGRNKLGGTLNASNGIISHNDICGVNVQTEGIDLSDLSDTVIYYENNYNNIDTSFLFVSEVSEAI